MASDRGSNVVDLDSAVQIGESLLDQAGYLAGILYTGGLGNIAFPAIVFSSLRMFFHLVNDGSDDLLFGADLVSGNETSLIIHVQKGTDI